MLCSLSLCVVIVPYHLIVNYKIVNNIIMIVIVFILTLFLIDELTMSAAAPMTSSSSTSLLPVAMEQCAGCRLPIEDRFLLRVMDNSWHERCLQCSACYEPLRQSCFVKDRRLLCRRDYDKSVSVSRAFVSDFRYMPCAQSVCTF